MQFPVDISALEDDAGNTSLGYTFLSDARNRGILRKQSNWILERILGDEALRTEWLLGSGLRPRAVTRYGEVVEQFRTKLLLLMHLTGGQPGRGSEVLSIRHRNTSYGGARNIFLWKGLVCFATSYHKGYRSRQKLKIVHRYLPDEVGVELVRYLWLVLPFWQNTLALVDKDDDDDDGEGGGGGEGGGRTTVPERSAYLFAQKIVRNGSSNNPEELWTGDRMRRRLEDATVRLMGTKVNIHDYRHMVIAIGRKYLHGIFKDSSGTAQMTGHKEGGSDGDGDDNDDASDEDGFAAVLAHQAAHSVMTDGITYGRTRQQFGIGTGPAAGAVLARQRTVAPLPRIRELTAQEEAGAGAGAGTDSQHKVITVRDRAPVPPRAAAPASRASRPPGRPAADAPERRCRLPRAAGGRARGHRTRSNAHTPGRGHGRGQEPIVPATGLLRVRGRDHRDHPPPGAAVRHG